ncbi:MAG TPA: DnaJ domain-containing protein, partial [Allosphingosinicella sp.]|nr:DnaJ domain-containing protein [Allosphingosinicella sp.]
RGKAVAAASMRPGEARRLLGLGEGATADEVREAHRRLIARVHPDAGGSAELATRVNAARDALLSELKRR